ncbi:hypothetical protein [Streptomyces sp. NBC_01363]|uniref:hypothetical protein n=1 Tax=Streptomyces sp. NBC_01363 TaxID=2903840 RepID=UPI00225898F7|nr:hypothetical protein [Streptomyces sp. NBC_01363]MCX4734355.1 hypothetical protein [Streptomyces sp. NBC_01363]
MGIQIYRFGCCLTGAMLLLEAGEYRHPSRSAADIVAQLNRVIAVPLLDSSAGRALATALALRAPGSGRESRVLS